MNWTTDSTSPGAIRSRRWRERHHGANAAQSRAFLDRHPEAKKAHVVRHNKPLRQQVFERDGGLCQVETFVPEGPDRDDWTLCLQPVDPDNWELDHIVPVLYGGPSLAENLRVSHPMCNRRRKRVFTENQIGFLCEWWTQNEMRPQYEALQEEMARAS